MHLLDNLVSQQSWSQGTTLISAIGHSQLLDHGCVTAFRPTYDSPTLPFISFAGR